jgi:hypothetical protein
VQFIGLIAHGAVVKIIEFARRLGAKIAQEGRDN